MCVIAVAQDKALTEEHVKRMFGANRDGAGIAWRENGKLQWRKGLDEDQMKDLCLTVPIPYVAHFRIASCGGIKPELTHPFPIGKDASLALKGATTGAVLFHNGHNHKWKDYLLQMALNGMKLPTGPWSDSRLMAWVAAHAGNHVLPFFEEKLVVFSMNDMEILGTGWSLVDDLYVSNRTWESNAYQWQGNRQINVNITVCRYGSCKKDRVNNTTWCEDHPNGVETYNRDSRPAPRGVTPIPRTFRGGHGDALGQATQQETVEEVAESLRGPRTEGERKATPSVDTPLDAGRRMISWVRALNPKTLRKPGTPIVVPPMDDDSQYYM